MTPETLWATEEEKREQFHAETVSRETFATLAGRSQGEVAFIAVVKYGIPMSEARAMTRAELIRWLDSHDPRD